MARIGFKKAKYNLIGDGKYKALTDNKVPDFEKVVDEKFAPNYATSELYANDTIAESVNMFVDGTLTLTVADDDDAFIAIIMGHKINTQGEVTSNSNDQAPELGYGHIIPKLKDGKQKYKVEFFPRVKFTKVTSDNKTKGSNIEFNTSSLEAKVMRLGKAFNGLAEGDWIKYQTFDTEAQAEEYLDSLLTPVA